MNESELIENEKKLGGWLRFFWCLNIVWLISFPLASISSAVVFLMPPVETAFALSDGLYLLSLVPNLVFSIYILKVIPVSNPTTPDRLKLLIVLELYTHIFIAVIAKVAFMLGYISEKPESITLVFSIIYAVIWVAYLIKSKRVANFYGSNATKNIVNLSNTVTS